jgi:hypothetical protein
MTVENRDLMLLLLINNCFGEEIRDLIRRRRNGVFIIGLFFVFVCLFVSSFFVCKPNTSLLIGLRD